MSSFSCSQPALSFRPLYKHHLLQTAAPGCGINTFPSHSPPYLLFRIGSGVIVCGQRGKLVFPVLGTRHHTTSEKSASRSRFRASVHSSSRSHRSSRDALYAAQRSSTSMPVMPLKTATSYSWSLSAPFSCRTKSRPSICFSICRKHHQPLVFRSEHTR